MMGQSASLFEWLVAVGLGFVFGLLVFLSGDGGGLGLGVGLVAWST